MVALRVAEGSTTIPSSLWVHQSSKPTRSVMRKHRTATVGRLTPRWSKPQAATRRELRGGPSWQTRGPKGADRLTPPAGRRAVGARAPRAVPEGTDLARTVSGVCLVRSARRLVPSRPASAVPARSQKSRASGPSRARGSVRPVPARAAPRASVPARSALRPKGAPHDASRSVPRSDRRVRRNTTRIGRSRDSYRGARRRP